MSYTSGRFCWYECATRGVDAAKAFYGTLFGWTAVEAPRGEEAYTVLQQDGRPVAGLYEMHGPAFEGVPAHWGTYVSVDDTDAAAAKARELGGGVLAGPFDVPGVGRMAVVRDPQGAVVQLLQRLPGEAPPPLASGPGTFCWSELATTEPEDAERFYTELLGWTASVQPMGEDATYTSFYGDGQQPVGGMMQMAGESWAGIPPHWMNYVAVEDTDATAARAEALGGATLVPPTDVPSVGRFAVLQDPTGAVFSVITPEPTPA